MRETYLGDGVYAVFDGYTVWLDVRAQSHLTTGPTGIPGIAIEPHVMRALLEFVEQCEV